MAHARDDARDTSKQRLPVRLGKLQHVTRQDLRHAAHFSRNDAEAASDCLQNGDTKRLGERCVEEDLATRQNARHVAMRHSTKQLDPFLQLVTVSHLLEGETVGTVPAHDEMNIREAAAHVWDQLHEQMRALAPDQPHHHHDVDRILGADIIGVGRELRGVAGLNSDHVGF